MFFEVQPGSDAGDRRYRELVEQLDMPMLIHVDGTIVFATQAVVDLVRVGTLDELMGRQLVDFIHPDDLELVFDHMLRVLAGEPSERHRYRIRRADGTDAWVEAAATPYLLGDVAAALVVVEDITGKLEAEAKLRASEVRYRALVQNSADIVAIVSAAGVLTYASPATAAVLGREVDEIAGTDVRHWLHPDDTIVIERLIGRLRHGPLGEGTSATFRVRHQDGTWRHLEAIATSRLDEPAIGGVVVNARDVTDRIAAAARLRRMALHDSLTGLANRTLIEDRIKQAVQLGPTAVVMLDLNRFKDINDSLVHAVGDVVLAEVADRIRRSVRSGDTVGRVGGDEFVLVLPQAGRMEDISGTVERIMGTLGEPVEHGTSRFRLSASVGIAFAPEHGTTGEGLLRAADAAMYRAKRERSGPAVYDHRDREQSIERLALSSELVDAIELGQFELHYQPKYDLASGRMTGAEALLRWFHPERGLIPPDGFLPLAEDTGAIHAITRWVVDTAVAQARVWAEQGHDLSVAVNLSPSSLQDPAFGDHVQSVLVAEGVPSERLVLEVTEQTVMADPETALRVMRRLSEIGVRFSVDDFGTGYSSLTYLRMLPVTELKIDRSFIGDDCGEVDHDIVETIIALSRRLGLQVVAEGIESCDATDYLRSAGCDVGQGFHLGHPVPADELDLDHAACAVHTREDVHLAS
ncbi:MAG TPA: EAL domain-containing protein [Acidimicrobiales bacterium]|nr:EAL domain-containing protein [Acidimicrobiales bacterium]